MQASPAPGNAGQWRRYGKIGLLQIRTTCLALLVTAVCCWPTTAVAQTAYRGQIEKLPVKVAPQPIPFSHKIHSRAGVKCLDCHSGATRRERAGLPTAGQCMLCHATVAKTVPPSRNCRLSPNAVESFGGFGSTRCRTSSSSAMSITPGPAKNAQPAMARFKSGTSLPEKCPRA